MTHALNEALILLCVLSFAAIVFLTLFPFDFGIPADKGWLQAIRERFTGQYFRLSMDLDCYENILLFLPLGVGLAGLLRARRRNWPVTFLIATIMGFVLTSCVETGQVFLGCRDPSLADICANTLGTFFGVILLAVGQAPLRAIVRIALRHRHWLTPKTALIPFIAWLGFNCWLQLRLARAGDMDYLNLNAQLVVGNETSANRPWSGTIHDFEIWNRGLRGLELDEALASSGSAIKIRPNLVAAYDLSSGNAPFVDQTGHGPPLNWQPPASYRARPSPANTHVDSARWLAGGPAPRISDSFVQGNAFTIAFTAATDNIQQGGPARIVSISDGTHNRNLTVGQSLSALALRFHCRLTGPNGGKPILNIPDVFTNTSTRRVVISYQDRHVIACVDTPLLKYGITFTPELAVMWHLYPRPDWEFRLGTDVAPIYRLLYRILVMLPLGLMVGIIWRLSDRGRFARFATVAGLIIPPLLIQGLIFHVAHEHWHIGWPFVSIVLSLAGFVVAVRHRSIFEPPIAVVKSETNLSTGP